jgi:hypothetical protein
MVDQDIIVRNTFITINVPLFLEVRDFMFFRREKHIISHFLGFFEGASTFLTSKLSFAVKLRSFVDINKLILCIIKETVLRDVRSLFFLINQLAPLINSLPCYLPDLGMKGYLSIEFFNPNPHCFIAITKATACGLKKPLLVHSPVGGRGRGVLPLRP